MASLADRVAIVTGGAGGLGKSIVIALLRAGASVVCCDVNEERLAESKAEFTDMGNVHTIAGDLSDPQTVENLFKETIDRYGKLDILVNNAGIMDRFYPIGDIDMALWDQVIATNLTAPARLSKFAINEFLRDGKPAHAAKGGVTLNIGSINGLRGSLAGAAYVTAKHGLVGLTRNTAAFYTRKGVRCNILMPGAMTTNIQEHYKSLGVHEEGRALTKKVSEMNPGDVDTDDLAKLAVFACSDDAKYLSGAIVSVDCGWHTI